jgi:hypothetical protein
MSDDRGPGAGNIIAGIFLILFGLCLTLLGGGCTVVWIGVLASEGSGGGDLYSSAPLILISIVTLGAGIALIWLGAKLMSGRLGR